MKKILLLCGFLASLLLWNCAASKPAVTPGSQTAQSFQKEIKVTVSANYLLYLPDGYDADNRKWPLMLFLHGAGERGDNLDLVTVHGPPKLIAAGKDFPCIVVSPQCPEEQGWNTDVLDALLNELVKTYRVDEDRIYVTGLSMGGFGTWALAQRYPHRFAAIAPVCGGGYVPGACELKHLPVWVFHGAKDPVVPLSFSEQMVEKLQSCGGNVKLTVYPEAGHDSWTETYGNPAFYEWLFQQRR